MRPRATPPSHSTAALAIASGLGRAPSEPDLRPRPPADPGATKPNLFEMRYGPQFHSSIEDLVARAVDLPPGTPIPGSVYYISRLTPDHQRHEVEVSIYPLLKLEKVQ